MRRVSILMKFELGEEIWIGSSLFTPYSSKQSKTVDRSFKITGKLNVICDMQLLAFAEI